MFADGSAQEISLSRLLEHLFTKNAKFTFFQRGNSIVFVKNLKFIQLLFLCKIDKDKVSEDDLLRKKIFCNPQ